MAVVTLADFSLDQYIAKWRTLLDATCAGKVDAGRQLCDLIEGEVEKLKQALYPRPEDFDAKVDRPTSYTQADNAWMTIRDSAHEAAIVVRDSLQAHRPREGTSRSTQDASRETQAAYCRRLLRLSVEASLYRLRMMSNFEYLGISHPKVDDIEIVNHERIRQVARILKKFRKTMDDWDRAIYRRQAVHLLTPWFEDADHLQLLSAALGPSSVVASKEPGWALVAPQVSEELYVRAREMRRRVYRQKGKIVDWLGLTAALVFTRHGTRMRRLVMLSIGLLLGSFLAYYVGDHLTSVGCDSVQFPSLWEYISYTFTILTGLGPTSTEPIPCGHWTLAFTTFESVVGYLSLALLASLIFDYFNRDRKA